MGFCGLSTRSGESFGVSGLLGLSLGISLGLGAGAFWLDPGGGAAGLIGCGSVTSVGGLMGGLEGCIEGGGSMPGSTGTPWEIASMSGP